MCGHFIQAEYPFVDAGIKFAGQSADHHNLRPLMEIAAASPLIKQGMVFVFESDAMARIYLARRGNRKELVDFLCVGVFLKDRFCTIHAQGKSWI